jgi:hypothetical protein
MGDLSQYNANVRDASVFRQLMDAINTYVTDCREYSRRVREYIAEKDEEFYKIKDILQQRLDDADRKLQQADLALTMCESRPSYDSEGHPQAPNCSSEQRARTRAREQVKFAQNCMNEMNAIFRKLEQVKAEFHNEEKRFINLMDEKLPTGSACLREENDLIHAYLNEHPRQK